MRQFSLGSAWTKGFGFFSGQAANHAIVLIGVGIAAPFVLQYLLMGGPMGMMNPTAMAQQGGLGGLAAMGGVTVLVVTVVTYVLQMGSYFASWRLGFGEGETLGGALGYGLVAGLTAILAFALVGILGLAVAQASMPVGIILILVALLPLFAMLYTAISAVVAVAMVLALLIALAVGSATDQSNPAFALAGGGGLAIAILVAVTALLFWLTARFSCVTPVLADRRTLNLIEAVGESWRLTSAAQWRIMLYLALLGVVLLVAFVILGGLVGIGMMSSMQSGGVPQMGLTTAIAGLIIGIPFAYLAVLVPAGIYRELADEAAPAKVFA